METFTEEQFKFEEKPEMKSDIANHVDHKISVIVFKIGTSKIKKPINLIRPKVRVNMRKPFYRF